MNLYEIILLSEKVAWKHWNPNCNVHFDDLISACPLKKANKSFCSIMCMLHQRRVGKNTQGAEADLLTALGLSSTGNIELLAHFCHNNY